MKRFLLLLSTLFFLGNLFARQIEDTSAYNDFLKDIKNEVSVDSSQSLKDLQQAVALSYYLDYKGGRAEAYSLLGNYYLKWGGDYENALKFYEKSANLYYDLGQLENEFKAIYRISVVYFKDEEPEKAIQTFIEALKKHPNEPYFGCQANNALAGIMKRNGDADKAIEYYSRSEYWYIQFKNPDDELKKIQLSNDKNRGVLYRNKEVYDTAEYYLNLSLQHSIVMNDSAWIARNYNSLGLLYNKIGEETKAENALSESLKIKRKLNYTDGVVTSLTNLASLKVKVGDYSTAKKMFLEAEALIDKIAEPRRQQVFLTGAEVYSALGDYKKAYDYLTKSNELSEKFNIEERSKITSELEAKYQNEANKILKKKLEAELESEKIQKQQKEDQLRVQRIFMMLGIGIGIVLLILLWSVYKANTKRKAANLELQKKNNEITQQNQQIELQKSQIQEKNTEILDSINYAKRIQQAILPSKELVKKLLGDSFIYYQPKDIVSGDFYFVEETPTHYFWAAADCTGHGVPGAMVSVVCHNALNRSVHEFGLEKPGEILDKTRELVIETFKKSEHQVKDGMDIALIVRKKGENKIAFAGANNPMWLVSEISGESDQMTSNDSKFELIEIRGDKQPVGMHVTLKPFTTHEITIKKNQTAYIFTDGFADQFGGEKGKKFKYKNLKSLLLNSIEKGIANQQQFLDDAFEEWKGNFEQLDDVCVMGVRL